MEREEERELDNVDCVDHWKEYKMGDHWRILSREMA